MSATLSLITVLAVMVCCIAVIRFALRKSGSGSAAASPSGRQQLYHETEHLPGNFKGFSVYKISNPAEAHTITEYFLVKKQNYVDRKSVV